MAFVDIQHCCHSWSTWGTMVAGQFFIYWTRPPRISRELYSMYLGMEETNPHCKKKNLGVQCIARQCCTGTATPKVHVQDGDMQHAYTCWPKDLDPTDQSAILKWIRRTERNDVYLQTVLRMARRTEEILMEQSL